MRLPGFTAEATVCAPSRVYRAAVRDNIGWTGAVVLQQELFVNCQLAQQVCEKTGRYWRFNPRHPPCYHDCIGF
jgi:hypothetical protein